MLFFYEMKWKKWKMLLMGTLVDWTWQREKNLWIWEYVNKTSQTEKQGGVTEKGGEKYQALWEVY